MGPLTRSDSAPVLEARPLRGENDEASSGHPGMPKSSSFSSSISQKGPPLAQGPGAYTPSLRGRKVSPAATMQPDPQANDDHDTVIRKLEKEEAQTLREALHIIDQKSEEEVIYEAAKMEAADLVWKHRNPKAADEEKTAAYFNPDLAGKKGYSAELAQGSQPAARNVSDGSTASQDCHASRQSRRTSKTKGGRLSEALKDLQLASEERAAAILAAARSERRRSSGKRLTSNGSNKSLFRNPDDQIYEEPRFLETPCGCQESIRTPFEVQAKQFFTSRFETIAREI